MRKSDGVRFDHEKKSNMVRLYEKKKSDGVRVDHEKRSDGEELTMRIRPMG